MSIFDREPGSWQELQDMTGQLFREMGCEVEVSKRVQHVRGTKEIDAYIRDVGVVPPALYLCECKHWKNRVPQEVVHAFRTVMGDVGAHRGFIISSAGFQGGAYEAVEHTNIDLVTFAELQAIFEDRWRISMGERLMPIGDRLFPYWDYPGRMPKFRWTAAHGDRNRALYEAYRPLAHLGPMASMEGFRQDFPVVLPRVNDRGQFEGEVTINSYRQLYDFIEGNAETALYHFQVVHGEVRPNRTPGEYDPLA